MLYSPPLNKCKKKRKEKSLLHVIFKSKKQKKKTPPLPHSPIRMTATYVYFTYESRMIDLAGPCVLAHFALSNMLCESVNFLHTIVHSVTPAFGSINYECTSDVVQWR